MDTAAWESHVSVPSVPSAYALFLAAVRHQEGGARTGWALNLMRELCQKITNGEDPAALPADAKELWRGVSSVLQPLTPQMKRKGLRLLRVMLGAVPGLAAVLRAFPIRVRDTPDPVQRRRHLVREDMMPAALRGTWRAELMDRILEHPASATWRTSLSARQTLGMVHHMLRTMGLTSCSSLGEFDELVAGLDVEDLSRRCREFCSNHCNTAARAGHYTRIQNLVFHEVLGLLPKALKPRANRKKVRTLQELDAALSDSSGRGNGGREGPPVRFLTVEQCRALEEACGDVLRSQLIVRLLLTTGLRRQGLVNIRIMDVAVWNEQAGRWEVEAAGKTLEKGCKERSFPLFDDVQELLDRWLNGGRPASPSRYVFPSAVTNNGQMSAETLKKMFRGLCKRAGLPRDVSHLHAMRHTCAHRLLDEGNTARQIAAYIGHSSAATTEKFYLKDRVENITQGMTVPASWAASSANRPSVRFDPTAARTDAPATSGAGREPPKKKHRTKPSIDLLKQAIQLRQERNSILVKQQLGA